MAKHCEQNLPKTFPELCDYVYRRKWVRERNAATIKGHIKQITEFFSGQLNPNDVTERQIEAFKSHLRSSCGNSNATVNRKLATLSSILEMGRRLDLLEKKPDIDFEKEAPGRDRFLTEDEVVEFQREAIKYSYETGEDVANFYDVFTFLLWTGCRFSEVANCKVYGTRDKMTARFSETKNGVVRTIPLPTSARKTVVAFKPPRMGYYAFYRLFNIVKTRTSMKNDKGVVPHILRHTCASWLVQRGVPLYTVSKWMGHTSSKTTERYAHLAPDQFETCLTALDT